MSLVPTPLLDSDVLFGPATSPSFAGFAAGLSALRLTLKYFTPHLLWEFPRSFEAESKLPTWVLAWPKWTQSTSRIPLSKSLPANPHRLVLIDCLSVDNKNPSPRWGHSSSQGGTQSPVLMFLDVPNIPGPPPGLINLESEAG